MPYIKPAQRVLIDGFVDNLLQALAGEGVDGKLNYAISRLVASSYAKNGKWSYSSIQRATGLFHCVANEFYDRVARPYEDEAIDRNGDIAEYQASELEGEYRQMVRFVVSQFSSSGTMSRAAFDAMVDSAASWEGDGQMFAFTNRLHADRFVVMHPETVTLGLDGLELRKCLQRT